ncbi:glycosyltransferase family 2 protein [Methylomonas koyamae]|uniref:glycosyltransferase family 2 protein n=1 Tax=Methylomonas koyamae TaxID=702114 RepID=UPI000AA6109F|nr:glycosyltransferase family 2 protein [Methylomonas koyamae]ATG90445.1 hypothetical protein MKLM6_2219 [Methylomonas koyamae]
MNTVTHSPLIAIILLNWNGKTDTSECIASIRNLNYKNYEIIVVDNNSSDDSVRSLFNEYPGLTILQTGKNLGYSGGNNFGINWAIKNNADYILLLNNDTIISNDLLNSFINASSLLPSKSILGAKIYFYDNPDTIWFAGGRWLTQLNNFEHIGYGQKDDGHFSEIVEVDYITGCALFSSTAAFREIGLLDDNFFLTYEETDWCYRAKLAGYRCYVIPEAKLWHKVSASFGGAESPLVYYFMTRNKLLWARKHMPILTRIKIHHEYVKKLIAILIPSFSYSNSSLSILKIVLWSLSSWLKSIKRNIENPKNKAFIFGFLDYLIGNFGDCPVHIRRLGK